MNSAQKGNFKFEILRKWFNEKADTLSFDVFFQGNDYLPYDDDAYASLSTVGNLFYSNISTVGDYGSVGWVAVSYTFATSGIYTLQFGVRNQLDNSFSSVMGADNVTLDAAAVPEPSSLALAGLGGIGLIVGAIRRRRAAAV